MVQSWPWHCPIAPSPRNSQCIALLWSKHGPQMVLKICSFWILINIPRDVPCQISHCQVYPGVPFLKNGQNTALLLPKHGSHMVIQIGSSLILINVPRDVPCQISHFLVYPVASFPKNCQKWPFMAKTGSFQLVLLISIIVPRFAFGVATLALWEIENQVKIGNFGLAASRNIESSWNFAHLFICCVRWFLQS